jgi:hypothetical protein
MSVERDKPKSCFARSSDARAFAVCRAIKTVFQFAIEKPICMRIGFVLLLVCFFPALLLRGQEINDLVFMHHSCGANWLSNSLDAALVAKDYVDERNDIYYGTAMTPDAGRPASLGGTPGDNTNMNHWICWFNDYLQGVRLHGCADGYNRIVMFKSCFPISGVSSEGTELGDPFDGDQTIVNYKALYRHPSGSGNTYSNGGYSYKPIEDIFAENPDVLFIPVTAPPLSYSSTNTADAHRARVFNNWLKNEWLASYNAAHPGLDNVAVYDWFDFLAYPDNDPTYPNCLTIEYGGGGGDSHPNDAANSASTVAFASGTDNFLDKAWLAFSTNSVQIETKIFLEGAYDTGGVMSDALNQNGFVPAASPYAEDPRTIASVPADIADWVLVELRLTPGGAPVDVFSALLRKDGRLVSDLGATPKFAMDAPDGDYHIVIKHRNHIPVMSNSSVHLVKGSSSLYDFTDGIGRFCGTGGAKELETGVFGMWSGDVNQDGYVTTMDYTLWYNSARTGESGYKMTDVNMDGQVTTTDYTIWYNNARQGASSQVP